MDAFDVLALAPAFDLDTLELERRYRDLQKQLHPDKFAQASASEKRISLARAVDVNQAYRTLRDDLKRAELLIARAAGTSVRAEAPAPPDLLMEVMELREALQEAKAERNQQAVAALEAEVAGRVSTATGELRSSLSALAQASTPEQLTKAQGALSRLRYYRRFQDEVARFHEETSE